MKIAKGHIYLMYHDFIEPDYEVVIFETGDVGTGIISGAIFSFQHAEIDRFLLPEGKIQTREQRIIDNGHCFGTLLHRIAIYRPNGAVASVISSIYLGHGICLTSRIS